MRFLPLLIIVLILLVQGWFLSDGSGDILASPSHARSIAYDSLARSLVEGRVTIDPKTIGYEAMQGVSGTVMYFGAFPALLRIPLLNIFPEVNWAKFLLLTASALALLAVLTLFSLPSLKCTVAIKSIVLLGVGLGSPLFYLASDSSIYHEAILWALCGTLWAIVALLRIVETESSQKKDYLLFGLGASVALLSRVTFALPLLVASAAFTIDVYKNKTGSAAIKVASQFFISLFPAILFQLWYNHARFGAPWILINYDHFHANPTLMGGEFNLFRLPDTLLLWFWPRLANLSAEFPFLHSIPAYSLLLPQLFTPWVERVIALPLSSPWCFFGGLAGALSVCSSSALVTRRETLILLSLISSCLVVLSFYFVPERYLAEFLPFLIVGVWLWLRNASKQKRNFFAGLVVLSIGATVLSTIDIHLMAVGDVGGMRKNRASLYQLYHPSKDSYHLKSLSRDEIRGQIGLSQKERCAAVREVDIRGAHFHSGIRQRMNCPVTIPVTAGGNYAIFALKNRRHLCEVGNSQLTLKDPLSGRTLLERVLSDRGQAVSFSLNSFNVPQIEVSWRALGKDPKDCARGVWLIGVESSR